MSAKYILHPRAQEDYEDSISWYLARSQNIAENFVKAINKTLKKICDNPYRWKNEFENFRELNVRGFPFIIIYSIEDSGETIMVAAVHHAKKNPDKKYR